MANVSNANAHILSPYGGLPPQLAHYLLGSQLGPLIRGLGFGGGPNAGAFDQRLNNATGPLAELIRGIRGFASGTLPQAQQIGNQIAGEGQQSYDALKSQINQSLSQLPNFQNAANQSLGYAQSAERDAFSPIRQSALFQRTTNDILQPLRSSEAARGIEGGGSAQAQEQNVLQNVGLNFAQNQQANQQASLSGLQNALSGALGTSQAGVGLASQQMGALPGLQSLLSQRYLSPMSASGNLLSLLTAGLTPGIQLTGATSPQLGQSSKGLGIL